MIQGYSEQFYVLVTFLLIVQIKYVFFDQITFRQFSF